MKLDHDFVQVSKLSEDQKKKSLPKVEPFFPQIQVKTKQKKGLHKKWNTFFPQIEVKTKKKRSSPKVEHFFPRIPVDTYSQMHTRVKLLGGDADVDHILKLLWEIQSNYWGGYIPPGFGTPDYAHLKMRKRECWSENVK